MGLGVIEDAFGVAAAVLETWKNSEKLRKTDGKSGEAWNMIEKSGNVPGLDGKMMGHDGNVCGTLRQLHQFDELLGGEINPSIVATALPAPMVPLGV